MKILLDNPPHYRHTSAAYKPAAEIPLGIMYVSASLRQQGTTNVEILDAGLPMAAHTYEQGMLWGMTFAAIISRIRESRPDIVGISCRYSTQHPVYAQLIAVIRREFGRGLKIILGGTHATVCSDLFFADSESARPDMIVSGEAESAAATSFTETDRVRPSPPITRLDDIPLPDYEAVNLPEYYRLQGEGFFTRRHTGGLREVSMITSRGCPDLCSFCSVHLATGRKYRAHSAEYVLDHLAVLTGRYRAEFIHFEDDNLTLDRERFHRILDGCLARNLRFSWDTPNGIRADHFDEQLVRKCKRTGCRELTIAVESGSERIRNRIIGKQLDLDAVHRAAELCRKHRIPLYNFMIVGFLDETPDEIDESLKLARNLLREYNVISSFFAPTPLPGTGLYEEMIQKRALYEPFSFANLAPATLSHRNAMIRNIYQSRERIAGMIDDYNAHQAGVLMRRRLLDVGNYLRWTGTIIKNPHIVKQYCESAYAMLRTMFRKKR